jgi:ADP-ribose pyrophosphatase YjhB (NUDIX family)
MSRTYPSYAIASVGCVVIKDKSLLLVRRGYAPGEGMWSIPGGVIEAGETIREAAKRELFEEKGLVAEPIGIIDVVEVITRSNNLVKFHYVILDVLFDANSVRGELRAGGDALDVAWFDLAEVISRNDVTRSTKKLAEKILRGEISLIKIT